MGLVTYEQRLYDLTTPGMWWLPKAFDGLFPPYGGRHAAFATTGVFGHDDLVSEYEMRANRLTVAEDARVRVFCVSVGLSEVDVAGSCLQKQAVVGVLKAPAYRSANVYARWIEAALWRARKELILSSLLASRNTPWPYDTAQFSADVLFAVKTWVE